MRISLVDENNQNSNSFSEEDLEKIRKRTFNNSLKGLIEKVNNNVSDGSYVETREDILKSLHELFYKSANLKYVSWVNPDASSIKHIEPEKEKSIDDYSNQLAFFLNLVKEFNKPGNTFLLVKHKLPFKNESFFVMKHVYNLISSLYPNIKIFFIDRDQLLLLGEDLTSIKKYFDNEICSFYNLLSVHAAKIADVMQIK